MTGPAASLRRVFTPDDPRSELREVGVSSTVLVQTWSSLDETRTFLETAAATDFIARMVGWVDLTDPVFAGSAVEIYGLFDGAGAKAPSRRRGSG